MKTAVLQNTWLKRGFMNFGWGNGYVIIPKGHKLHSVHYDNINVDVHGGLTFSELVDLEMIDIFGLDKEDEGNWCVGFDTCHYGDNLLNWSRQRVRQETERLKNQLLKI